MSDSFCAISETHSSSFHIIRAKDSGKSTSSIPTLCAFFSIQIIVQFSALHASIAFSIFSKYSHGTQFSAQSAVFVISFRGGVGVYPIHMTRSKPAPSAVRKMAQTLLRDRIFSRMMAFI